MRAVVQFQLHVERFARWYALLTGFDLAVLAAAGWTVWQWRGHDELGLMAGFALAAFLMVLTAQLPYWKIGSFTLVHGASGWLLRREHQQHRLADVRALSLPGVLVILGLSDKGRVVLPVSSDISPAAWRELRTRLAL